MAAVLDVQNTLSQALDKLNQISAKLDSLPAPVATQADIDALNDSANSVNGLAQTVLDKVNALSGV